MSRQEAQEKEKTYNNKPKTIKKKRREKNRKEWKENKRSYRTKKNYFGCRLEIKFLLFQVLSNKVKLTQVAIQNIVLKRPKLKTKEKNN